MFLKLHNINKLFLKGAQAFARAERQGVHIDIEFCERQIKLTKKKIKHHQKKLQKTELIHTWRKRYGSKMNIDSNVQMANILYCDMGIEPLKKTSSGRGSTDEATLSKIKIDGIEDILTIRKLKKAKSTYLDNYMRIHVNGIIHPSLCLHTAITGRSSCQSPNLQNVPARNKSIMNMVRGAIIPRIGRQLLEVDFSSLEVMIAACYHKDPTMLKYLNNPKSDMHGDMAQQIFQIKNFNKKLESHSTLRKAAKNAFVFPQFYGDYYGNNAIGLCEWVKLPQREWSENDGMLIDIDGEMIHIGEHLINQGIKSFDGFLNQLKRIEEHFWNKRFPKYKKWREDWWANYQKTGEFSMFTGFRCKGIMGKNDAVNYPVQGAAFHCLLWSFIRMDQIIIEKGWDTKLILQIHDSMLFDTNPKELDEVVQTIYDVTCKQLPKAWKWITVPLDVEAEVCEVNDPWSKKKEYRRVV